MSDEEKKAIEDLKEISNYCSLRAIDIMDEYSDLWARYVVSIQKVKNFIEKQQAEIDKKDKIMDKMAGNVFLMNGDRGCTKQEIIEYFTKQIEGENK